MQRFANNLIRRKAKGKLKVAILIEASRYWFQANGNTKETVPEKASVSKQVVRKSQAGGILAFSCILASISIFILMFAAKIANQSGEDIAIIRLISGMFLILSIVLLFSENTDLSLDEKGKKLIVRKSGVFRNVLQKIPLSSISGVRVRKRQTRNGIEQGYTLQIRCKDGKSIIKNGGIDSENEFYDLAERISESPGVEKDMPYMLSPLPLSPALLALISLICAQGVYAIIYGAQTNWHFCPAMWAGGAPPMVIGSVFLILWRSLCSIRIKT